MYIEKDNSTKFSEQRMRNGLLFVQQTLPDFTRGDVPSDILVITVYLDSLNLSHGEIRLNVTMIPIQALPELSSIQDK